jgi:hypothetical protein
MRAGWWKSWLEPMTRSAVAPDSSVEVSPRWLVRAALLASTAALLATTRAGPPEMPPETIYRFERGADGEAFDLTQDKPTASFLVTLRALELGPENVQSTESAGVTLSAFLTRLDEDMGNQPSATVRLGQAKPEVFDTAVAVSQSLLFEGTCEKPAENAPCQAAFTVDFARTDDGAVPVALHIEWSLDLHGSGKVSSDNEDQSGLGAPWSVEITPQ